MGLWTSNESENRINEEDFDIQITDQQVHVHLQASAKSPHGRFYWALFFVALWFGAICLLLFSDGKHGESNMWHDLNSNPVTSSDFIVPLLILLGMTALMVLMSWRYVPMAFPSDEILTCDRSTLTISKVRWLDFANNDWRTRTYPIDCIEDLEYKAVARAKGRAVYGLHFRAAGISERVLPGLGTQDAGRILAALKSLGAR